MAVNKKYFYLKFKENYFNQDDIKVIEAMKNGYEYSLIIIKLYLKSLKFEGQLKINHSVPYTRDKIDILAGVLGHDPANVMHAINLAKELGIIKIVSTGEIFMTDIQNFIGHSSTEAERIAAYRRKIKGKIKNNSNAEKELKNNKECTDVQERTKMYNNVQITPYKRLLELDLDIEIDLEKDINKKLSATQKLSKKFNLSTKTLKGFFNDIKSLFIDKYEVVFDNYAAQGKAIYSLIEKSLNRNHDFSPVEFIEGVINKFLELKEVNPKFWKPHPLLPTKINSSGLWPMILEAMKDDLKKEKKSKKAMEILKEMEEKDG